MFIPIGIRSLITYLAASENSPYAVLRKFPLENCPVREMTSHQAFSADERLLSLSQMQDVLNGKEVNDESTSRYVAQPQPSTP